MKSMYFKETVSLNLIQIIIVSLRKHFYSKSLTQKHFVINKLAPGQSW